MKCFSLLLVFLFLNSAALRGEEPPRAAKPIPEKRGEPGHKIVKAFAEELGRELSSGEREAVQELALETLRRLRAFNGGRGLSATSPQALSSSPVAPTPSGGVPSGGAKSIAEKVEQTTDALLDGHTAPGKVVFGAVAQFLAATLEEGFTDSPGRELTPSERKELFSKLSELSSKFSAAENQGSFAVQTQASNALRRDFRAKLVKAEDERVRGAFARIVSLAEGKFAIRAPFGPFMGFPTTLAGATKQDSAALKGLLEIDRKLKQDFPVSTIAVRDVNQWFAFVDEILTRQKEVLTDCETLRSYLGINSLLNPPPPPAQAAPPPSGSTAKPAGPEPKNWWERERYKMPAPEPPGPKPREWWEPLRVEDLNSGHSSADEIIRRFNELQPTEP